MACEIVSMLVVALCNGCPVAGSMLDTFLSSRTALSRLASERIVRSGTRLSGRVSY